MKSLFAFLLLFSCVSFAAPAADEVPVGGLVRDQMMNGLTGDSKKISGYFGKPLIINIWASYCPPCLAEMASLEQLHQRYPTQFNLIGISIDDYPERAHVFLDKANTTFPHYIDHKLQLENMFGAHSIPLTIFVDAQGRILRKVPGAQTWDSPEVIEAIGKIFDIKM